MPYKYNKNTLIKKIFFTFDTLIYYYYGYGMIKQFTDYRGDFTIFNVKECNQVNIVSNTQIYTFRGLHYQTDPAQIKTVKVIQGKVLDILYNLKTKTVDFYVLDKFSNPLYINQDYAHGYLTLEPNTIFTYGVEGEYNPESEHSIVWDSIPQVKEVIWSHIKNIGDLIISEKDREGK